MPPSIPIYYYYYLLSSVLVFSGGGSDSLGVCPWPSVFRRRSGVGGVRISTTVCRQDKIGRRGTRAVEWKTPLVPRRHRRRRRLRRMVLSKTGKRCCGSQLKIIIITLSLPFGRHSGDYTTQYNIIIIFVQFITPILLYNIIYYIKYKRRWLSVKPVIIIIIITIA